MVLSGVDRIEGVSTKISIRKKQPQVMLNVSPEELPAEYVRVTHKPDLTRIRAALKTDTECKIDWASFSEDLEYSVTIR